MKKIITNLEEPQEKIIVVKTKNPKVCQISGSIGSIDHAYGLQEVQNRYSSITGECCEDDVEINGNKIDFGCPFKIRKNGSEEIKRVLIEVETEKSYTLDHSLEQYLKSDLFVISNMGNVCGIARNEIGMGAMQYLGIEQCPAEMNQKLENKLSRYTRKILKRMEDN